MGSCEKILIAGFSGAGKTSFLRELEYSAPNSDWDFQDLDQLILKSRGKGEKLLSKVIETHGWDKFRLWERQELEGWLKEEGKGVLSLGGGTLSQLVLDLYKPIRKIEIVYLHASFEECWERLRLDASEERPLTKLGQLEMQRIYEERQRVFSQIPWVINNNKSSDLSNLANNFWLRVGK